MWGLSLIWEHTLLGAHGVGLSRGPHLLLKESLLRDLQTGSCLGSQGLEELAQLCQAPLLHEMLLPPWRVAHCLGWLDLPVVAHLLPPLLLPLGVSELRRHGVTIHVHPLSLGAHPSHGGLELLLRLFLGQAGPLVARLRRLPVLHVWISVDRLLTWHGRGLQPWLALGHARLPRKGVPITVGILGNPLLDKYGQQLGVGKKNSEHLLLLEGSAGRPENLQKVV